MANAETADRPARRKRRARWRRAVLLIAAGAVAAGALPAVMTICADRRWDQRPLTITDRPPRGGLDVTLLVAADTPCGVENPIEGEAITIEQLLDVQVEQMNGMNGRPWPAQIGGVVDKPRGVLIAGDLTEDGLPAEWEQFVTWFGRTGQDAKLRLPVYACTGNHDRNRGSYVAARIAERHGADYYSVDFDDLHVVSLGEYPTVAAVNWLRRDLAAAGRLRPIVLFTHYPPPGEFSKRWWINKPENYRRLAKVIEGFRVIAIFHGHHHGTGHYRWAGAAVYNVGATNRGTSSFAVVRVTDDAITVGYWQWRTRRWQWLERRHLAESGAPERAAEPAENAHE